MTKRAVVAGCLALAVCSSAATAVTMQAVDVAQSVDKLLLPAWLVAIVTSVVLGGWLVLKLRESQPSPNGNGSSVESHTLGKMEGMLEELRGTFRELTTELRAISDEMRKHNEEQAGAGEAIKQIGETHKMVEGLTKRTRRGK